MKFLVQPNDAQFLSQSEEEITYELFRLNFVTKRGYRIDDESSSTNLMYDVDNRLDESMHIIKVK